MNRCLSRIIFNADFSELPKVLAMGEGFLAGEFAIFVPLALMVKQPGSRNVSSKTTFIPL